MSSATSGGLPPLHYLHLRFHHLLLLSFLLLLLISDVFGDHDDAAHLRKAHQYSKVKKDPDCNEDTGICGWTYQDAFCSHAPSKIVNDSITSSNGSSYVQHDFRYRIHSFGIAHGTLYIFAASAFFAVPLGHPPFSVSHGLTFSGHLSNEMPNNFYRDYRSLNYNFATLVLELDADWELFVVATFLNNLKQFSQMWHTQQVIRNRRHEGHYEAPPGVFAFGFNAFFGDIAKSCERDGEAGRDCLSFTLDRIITGEGFFFHVQQRVVKKEEEKVDEEDKTTDKEVQSVEDETTTSMTTLLSNEVDTPPPLPTTDENNSSTTTNQSSITPITPTPKPTTITPPPDPSDEGKKDPHFYTITRYELAKGNFSFKLAEYLVYPKEACSFANTTKSWYLERKDRLTEEQISQLLPVSSNLLAARFPIALLKNGYIHGGKMYLSKLDFIEVYAFSEVEGTNKFSITWEKTLVSEELISCRLWDVDNAQFRFISVAGYAFIAGAIVLLLCVTMNRMNSGPSRRYLVLPGGELVCLTDAMVFGGSDGGKKK